MRYLGQHFLTNRSAVRKIVAAVAPRAGETLIEIGAGGGELTRPLSEACGKIGCKIVAIERDTVLGDRLCAAGLKNVEVVSGDALALIPALNSALAPPARAVVGNIPYYITGRFLKILGGLEQRPERVVLTLQKEVAERLAASPPRMNRLAASVQLWASVKILGALPRSDFSPPPEVDSAIVKLEARSGALGVDEKDYFRAVKMLFQQPRKTVGNNLAAAFRAGRPSAALELKKIGIDPQSRPHDLGIAEIKTIAKALGGK